MNPVIPVVILCGGLGTRLVERARVFKPDRLTRRGPSAGLDSDAVRMQQETALGHAVLRRAQRSYW